MYIGVGDSTKHVGFNHQKTDLFYNWYYNVVNWKMSGHFPEAKTLNRRGENITI